MRRSRAFRPPRAAGGARGVPRDRVAAALALARSELERDRIRREVEHLEARAAAAVAGLLRAEALSRTLARNLAVPPRRQGGARSEETET